MSRSDFPSSWVEVEGLRTHYKCLGKGSTVILLHGGSNDWSEWQKNLDSLAESFRVYAVDLPGYGLSQLPGTPLSPSWFASFLRNYMEALGITTAHLIGHSLGGTIALAFALDFPERVKKLVLVASGGLGEVKLSGKLLLFLIRGIKRLVGKEKSRGYKAASRDDWLFTKRLHKLQPPTLIVWGERDPYYSVSQAKLAQSLIPNSQLHIFSHCRHAPQREKPEEFNKLVSYFLAD